MEKLIEIEPYTFRLFHNSNEKVIIFQTMPGYLTQGTFDTTFFMDLRETFIEFKERFFTWINGLLDAFFADNPEEPEPVNKEELINDLLNNLIVSGTNVSEG